MCFLFLYIEPFLVVPYCSSAIVLHSYAVGNDVTVEPGLTVTLPLNSSRTKIDVTPKMSLFSDYVYVTDSATQSVMRINRHTGQPPENVSSEMFPSVPVAVKVIHPSNQPAVEIQAAFSPG